MKNTAVIISLLAIFAFPVFAGIEDIAWQHGPLTAPLDEVASVLLPDGFVIAEKDNVKDFLEYTGNIYADNNIALIAKGSITAELTGDFIQVFYEKIGFVQEDKKEINKKRILMDKIETQDRLNPERKAKGFSTGTITGWAVEPYYDDVKHTAEYAVSVDWKTADGQDDGTTINFYTAVLGREGILSVQAVFLKENFDQDFKEYKKIIDSLGFNPEFSYESVLEKPLEEKEKVSKYNIADLFEGKDFMIEETLDALPAEMKKETKAAVSKPAKPVAAAATPAAAGAAAETPKPAKASAFPWFLIILLIIILALIIFFLLQKKEKKQERK